MVILFALWGFFLLFFEHSMLKVAFTPELLPPLHCTCITALKFNLFFFYSWGFIAFTVFWTLWYLLWVLLTHRSNTGKPSFWHNKVLFSGKCMSWHWWYEAGPGDEVHTGFRIEYKLLFICYMMQNPSKLYTFALPLLPLLKVTCLILNHFIFYSTLMIIRMMLQVCGMSFVQHGPGCNVTALTYIAGLICTTLIFINRKHLVIFHSFVRFKNRFKKKKK